MDPNRIFGFAPVYRADARLLILGSMPSVESLHQSFYYAHPRNCFWPMMAQILGAEAPLDIDAKKQMLMKHRIALWDTVHSCQREGSLDSAIRSAEPNDFETLYQTCPQIQTVLFNGAAAQQLYQRLVSREDARFVFQRMPSTSPAYTLKYENKLSQWQQAVKEALKI
jgi:TDG/mug DNA glycosylase family protein